MLPSKNKENLLIIAPNLPRYDKNSGDFRLFQLLKILLKSHEITYLGVDSIDCEKDEKRYLSEMAVMKITTYVKNFSLPKILLKNKFKAAFIEFYYLSDHFFPRIKLLRPNCPVIVDTVDLHYRRAYSKYNLTGAIGDYESAERIKKSELNSYKMADMVITITEEEKNILHTDCNGLNIWTIPNIHETISLHQSAGKNNLLFVGGFSHDPNVDAVTFFCEKIFPLIKNRNQRIKLTIAGNNPPESVRKFQCDSIIVTGYVPSLTPLFRDSYISVAPLRYGAGMKGKIGEAMSYGLPVVTTSIGAQGFNLIHGYNAMVSDSPLDFATSVLELIENDNLYQTIRKNAQEYIKNTCSPEFVEKKFFYLFEELNKINIKKLKFQVKLDLIYQYINKKFTRKNIHK